jgi:hypothetical protein
MDIFILEIFIPPTLIPIILSLDRVSILPGFDLNSSNRAQ